MKFKGFLVSVAFVCLSSSAMAVGFRDLVMQAVAANDGKAKGVLSDAVADTIRGQIGKPNARIMAEVTTIATLPQEGCKRLKIRFTTPGTLLPTKEGKDQMFDAFLEMNVCPDGQPPV